MGQNAKINVEALSGAVIDPVSQRHTLNLKVMGGYCGVIIDARARPLILPKEPNRRQELYNKWAFSLGIKTG